MKEGAGCCKNGRYQTNEFESSVGALCDGGFWRFSGEYGVLRVAKMKQTKTFVLRRNELYGVAVKQWNRNCATGEL